MVDGSGVTQPVSAAALPLPSGAATAAAQATLLTELQGKADTAEAQVVDGSAVTQPVSVAAPATIYNGKTAVTTATTRVVLAASQAITSGVTIKAEATNTGIIYVGNATVAAANGFELAAGEHMFLEVANLNTVNIDASVSTDGVSYIAT